MTQQDKLSELFDKYTKDCIVPTNDEVRLGRKAFAELCMSSKLRAELREAIIGECECEDFNPTFGERMNGYTLELISRRDFEGYSPANQYYVTKYKYCHDCGGKIKEIK